MTDAPGMLPPMPDDATPELRRLQGAGQDALFALERLSEACTAAGEHVLAAQYVEDREVIHAVLSVVLEQRGRDGGP